MATCKKCKCNDKYCGCSDKAVPVSPPCGQDTLYCPSPELCPELFATNCVLYSGDTIVDLGINKGERLDVIMQKLALWITNPTCIDDTGGCKSPVGVKSTYIASSLIKIKWEASLGAAYYTVEWKEAGGSTWTASSAITPTTYPEYLIQSLVAETEYYIRVKSVCTAVPPNPAETCYSVTISVTTIA